VPPIVGDTHLQDKGPAYIFDNAGRWRQLAGGVTVLDIVADQASLPSGVPAGGIYYTADTKHAWISNGRNGWLEVTLNAPAGPPGPIGPQGIPGTSGRDGVSTFIAGTLDGNTPLPDPADVKPGAIYIVSALLSGDIRQDVKDAFTGRGFNPIPGDGITYRDGEWVDVGQIRGPRGPLGPVGPPGLLGPPRAGSATSGGTGLARPMIPTVSTGTGTTATGTGTGTTATGTGTGTTATGTGGTGAAGAGTSTPGPVQIPVLSGTSQVHFYQGHFGDAENHLFMYVGNQAPEHRGDGPPWRTGQVENLQREGWYDLGIVRALVSGTVSMEQIKAAAASAHDFASFQTAIASWM
jgi:hypothetical protein